MAPTKAEGAYSFAFGLGSYTNNVGSIAFGMGASSTGYSSTAFGRQTNASGSNSTAFGSSADATGYSSVASFTPRLKPILRAAAANAIVSEINEIKVYHLKQKASLFGHNTPRRLNIPSNGGLVTDAGDWEIIDNQDSVDGNFSNEEETRIQNWELKKRY